jgi:[acyl-carrier-protein] S-malonyltransferase
MAGAAKAGKPHGMLSIIGLDDATLSGICDKARAKIGADTVCEIANYLFPTGRVVSGHKDALAEVCSPVQYRLQLLEACLPLLKAMPSTTRA